MRPEDDGYVDTPKKGKRKRGARCATGEVKYFFSGNKLIPITPWWAGWKPWRCSGRVEKGQTFCINCRRVHAELAKEAEKKL